MKTITTVHHTAPSLNGTKINDRGIITGIGNYLSSTEKGTKCSAKFLN